MIKISDALNDEYDVELIIGTVKESPAESEERLAQFGLL